MIQYSAKLSNGVNISLFGADYYHDKRVFWSYHVSNVYTFIIEVSKDRFPVLIVNEYDPNSVSIEITQFSELQTWIKNNQSVDQDIYFSMAINVHEIQLEFLKVCKLFKEFLQLKITSIKTGQFDLWSTYSDFDLFHKKVCIAETNIERNKISTARKDLTHSIKDCFISTINVIDNLSGLTIIEYAKQEHSKIQAAVLLNLCEKGLEMLSEKQKLVIF